MAYQGYQPGTFDPYMLMMLMEQQAAQEEAAAQEAKKSKDALAKIAGTSGGGYAGYQGIGAIGGSTAGGSLPLVTSSPSAVLPGLSPVLPSGVSSGTGAGLSSTMGATSVPTAVAPSATAMPAASGLGMALGTAGVIATPIVGKMIGDKYMPADLARPFKKEEAIKSSDMSRKFKGFDGASDEAKGNFMQELFDRKLLKTTGKGVMKDGAMTSSDPMADWAFEIKNPFRSKLGQGGEKPRWKDIQKEREFQNKDLRSQLADARSSGSTSNKYLEKVGEALDSADATFGEGASTSKQNPFYGNGKISSLAIAEAMKKKGMIPSTKAKDSGVGNALSKVLRK